MTRPGRTELLALAREVYTLLCLALLDEDAAGQVVDEAFSELFGQDGGRELAPIDRLGAVRLATSKAFRRLDAGDAGAGPMLVRPVPANRQRLALARLDRLDRVLVALHLRYGLRGEQLATIAQVPPEGVEERLTAALAAFAAAGGSADGEPAAPRHVRPQPPQWFAGMPMLEPPRGLRRRIVVLADARERRSRAVPWWDSGRTDRSRLTAAETSEAGTPETVAQTPGRAPIAGGATGPSGPPAPIAVATSAMAGSPLGRPVSWLGAHVLEPLGRRVGALTDLLHLTGPAQNHLAQILSGVLIAATSVAALALALWYRPAPPTATRPTPSPSTTSAPASPVTPVPTPAPTAGPPVPSSGTAGVATLGTGQGGDTAAGVATGGGTGAGGGGGGGGIPDGVATPFTLTLSVGSPFHTDPIAPLGAYVRVARTQTPVGEVDPAPAPFSWNAAGQQNTIERTFTGEYLIVLHGVFAYANNVQVTAYGDTPHHCKPDNWVAHPPDEWVYVACFDDREDLVDAPFSLAYYTAPVAPAAAPASRPTPPPRWAFAWVNTDGTPGHPGTPYVRTQGGSWQYDPDRRVRALTITDVHERRGTYAVRFPTLASDRAVATVTAVERWNPTTCQVAGTSRADTDEVVEVRCFDASGRPADATFDIAVVEPTRLPASTGAVGYASVFADDPSPAGEAVPTVQFDSAGGGHQVSYRADPGQPGHYTIHIDGQPFGASGGNVQVSAAGDGGGDPVRCQVVSAAPAAGSAGQDVHVWCRASGQPFGGQGPPAVHRSDPPPTFAVAEVGPAGAVISAWGTWRLQPSTTDIPQIPVDIAHASAGVYLVDLPAAGSPGGVAHVVEEGPRANGSCQVDAMSRAVVARTPRATNDELVGVRCFDAHGGPSDAAFNLSFVQGALPSDAGATSGYASVWAQDPSPAGTVVPAVQYDTAGGPISYSRPDAGQPGRYLVHIEGRPFATSSGNVQVTAQGSDPTRCAIAATHPSATGEDIQVACTAAAGGAGADSAFLLSVAIGGPPHTDPIFPFGGSLLDDQPDAPVGEVEAVPTAQSWNGMGYASTVKRTGAGRYQVVIERNGWPTAGVELTAAGPTSGYCTLLNAVVPSGRWPLDEQVLVGCFDARGNPADAAFSLAFFSNAAL